MSRNLDRTYLVAKVRRWTQRTPTPQHRVLSRWYDHCAGMSRLRRCGRKKLVGGTVAGGVDWKIQPIPGEDVQHPPRMRMSNARGD